MDRSVHVLLVEDDPVSCRVFTLALDRAGIRVDACDRVRTACEAAVRSSHDLWLIDAHLPDGDGIALLASLRAQGHSTRAIAHTASRDPALHARLREAGFVDVLVKPLPAAELVAALALPLGGTGRSDATAAPVDHPGWDDVQALRALGGCRDSLVALRGLFVRELPDALARCRAAVHGHDHDALRAEVHRLQASCAFVGAATLLMRVHALRDAPDASTLAAFEREAAALMSSSLTDPG